jgi:hypothetical protein
MKSKTFDCVQMKWDIQQRLQVEEQGLSAAERNRRAELALERSPVLAKWWREVRGHQAQPRIAAETPASYGVKPAKQRKRK